jgi:aromatic ring hydroxylase
MTTVPSDAASVLPYTGAEFFDSFEEGGKVWTYGKRVKNIGEHPSFQNTARMVPAVRCAASRLEREKAGSELAD